MNIHKKSGQATKRVGLWNKVWWAAVLIAAGSGYAQERVAVTFTGGHETEQRDHGRPDILIAAALKVPTGVFREAFSHVTPASGGHEPDPAQVRLNKSALLHALGPYGVTNDRLDEVSSYYRYNRPAGVLLWRATPAVAYAIVRNGVVTGFTIADSGSGYTTPPNISVPGFPNVKVTATLAFSSEFKENGSIKQLAIDETSR